MLTSKQKLSVLAVFSALGLSACGSDSDPVVVPPPPRPPVVVAPTPPPPLAFVVSGGVSNFTTGDVIAFADSAAGQTTLRFFEGDEPSANVVNLAGTAITSLTTTDGGFAFRLKEGANPQLLTVAVSAPGYLDKSFLLDLSDTSQSISANFQLVAADAPGLAVAAESAPVTSGTTSSEITVSATQSSSVAAVSVPAGTVLQNAAGQPVSGTQVSLNVATAAPVAGGEEVGLTNIVPLGLNEATDNLIRIPLAGANVTMTDNQGNDIKRFSTPITLSLSMPASDNVAAGDTLSISSYDEATGVWTRDEFSATVGALDTATNSHKVTFETDHLTFFSANRSTPVCTAGISYSLTGDAVPGVGLTVEFASSDVSIATWLASGSTSGTVINSNRTSRFGISSEATARVTVKSPANNSIWYDSEVEVPVCGTVAINLTNPAPTVSESFNANLVCTNDTSITRALTGALVSYGLPGRIKVQATDNNNGSYSLSDLVQGSSYEVRVEPVGVPGASISNFTITADGAAETGNVNLACSTATGAG